jgi:hypothetical protein
VLVLVLNDINDMNDQPTQRSQHQVDGTLVHEAELQ